MLTLRAHQLTSSHLDGDAVLLVLGRDDCPACGVLGASARGLALAWPELMIISAGFASAEDWRVRDALLWPRGISASRAVMPTLCLLRAGAKAWQAHGARPAQTLIAELTPLLGQPDSLPDPAAEQAALARIAPRRAGLAWARGQIARD